MKNALSNEYENRLLKHMVDMAHSVGVKICIEGIEEKEELERIMLLKPDYIQGFYYGRPVSLSVFMESYEYKTNKYVTYSFLMFLTFV